MSILVLEKLARIIRQEIDLSQLQTSDKSTWVYNFKILIFDDN